MLAALASNYKMMPAFWFAASKDIIVIWVIMLVQYTRKTESVLSKEESVITCPEMHLSIRSTYLHACVYWLFPVFELILENPHPNVKEIDYAH